IISSSRLTLFPAGFVSKPVLLLTSKERPAPPDGAMWLALVRIMASDPVEPVWAPVASNFGSTRSRGLNFGVLALETFSDSTACRAWCHCILVRNADKTGRSLIDIAAPPFSPEDTTPSARQILPRVWLTSG